MTDTTSAAPTYEQVIASWNAQADEHNQWDALGEDEKIEWAVACAKAAPAAQGDAEDAARYRWLRDKNSHYLHNRAWLASITAVKDGPCYIFSADEVAALLDAEIDRRMASARKQGANHD